MKAFFLRFVSFLLLGILSSSILTLSQLDNLTTSKIYFSVINALHIDLKSLQISFVQITDTGHIVAGFVMGILALIIIQRSWVLPFTLLFFFILEAAQLLSVDRQASGVDLLRSWSGVLTAWVIIAILKWFLSQRKKAKGWAGDI